MKTEIFKAYDIRGRYPKELNEAVIRAVSYAIGRASFKRGQVVLGRDARLSSPSLYQAARQGLEAAGLKVVAAGLMTTPMFYFLVNKLKARGGLMITASHNPKDYNGLKIVGARAVPISGTDIRKLVIGL